MLVLKSSECPALREMGFVRGLSKTLVSLFSSGNIILEMFDLYTLYCKSLVLAREVDLGGCH